MTSGNQHNSSATVQVTNNFPYAANITINHTYDTSPTERHTWLKVLPATTTGPDMIVTFNIGFGHIGHDKWQAVVDVLDGPNKGQYISDSGACTLHSGDVGQVLTFVVDAGRGFQMHASSNNDVQAWTTHP